MFTEIDKKIILALQQEGRASYSDLASGLGISASTISRRIVKFIDSKAIAIRALPNPYKMGLSANALIAIKCDPAEIDTVCKQMNKNFYINNIHTVFGWFDILTMVYFPSWELLHHFINKELFAYRGVDKVEIFHVNEIRKRYYGLFAKEPGDFKLFNFKPIDQQLIESLVENGRMGTSELAKKLGVHESMVSRRISSLLKEEIIKICAVPNPEMLGYLSNATMILEVDTSRLDNICQTLIDLPEVHLVMTMIKENSFVIGVHAKNNKLLSRIIKEKIISITGIKSTETFIRAEVKKLYYGWFID